MIGFPKPKRRKKTPARRVFEAALKEVRTARSMRRNKFGAVPCKAHGYSFDSGLERAFFEAYLMPLVASGEISGVVREKKVVISIDGEKWTGYPDFMALNTKTNRHEYYECKGGATAKMDRWRTWKKLWKIAGPAVLHVFVGSKSNFIHTESIYPIRQVENPGIA